VESVSPSRIEAVVVDACWHEFSHYERLSSISRVVLLCTAIYDVGCCGARRAAAVSGNTSTLPPFLVVLSSMPVMSLLRAGVVRINKQII